MNALDIANYIIYKAKDKNIPITHLKLQKLLYYVVAKYLKDTGKCLINEPIYKWQYGPVVVSVYHQFKIYGDFPIEQPISYLTDQVNMTFANVNEINQSLDMGEIANTVSTVLNYLGSEDAFALVRRTHDEPAWYNHENLIRKGQMLHYTNNELSNANI